MGAVDVHRDDGGTSSFGEVERSLFEHLDGTVTGARSFGENQHASASFERFRELAHSLFGRGPIASFDEDSSRQFIQFPQKRNLANARLAQKDDGPWACAERRIDVDEAGVIGHQNNAFAFVCQCLGFGVDFNVQFGHDDPLQQRPRPETPSDIPHHPISAVGIESHGHQAYDAAHGGVQNGQEGDQR